MELSHVVVHYAEIALKGQNRPVFENQLVSNIRIANKLEKIKVQRLHGRILIILEEPWRMQNVVENLGHVFGVSNFSPCIVAENDIDDIKKKSVKIANSLGVKNTTFRIETIRSNKGFPIESQKVNEIVGDAVNNETGWNVDLKNPKITIYAEIHDKSTFVYTRKIEGPGGLPVGVSGRVICLLSGGIDSPVAAWHMMKRGCEVIFVHFHTYTSKIEKKIADLVHVLNKYQFSSRIYYVPFFDAQEKIIDNVSPEFRIVVFRKFMMRFAAEIAIRENAKAIVTGDNVAQVASQTLENLGIIYEGSKYPILAPLIGFDKKDIIAAAKNIGTYEASVQQYQDCCSALVAKHPSTRTKMKDVEGIDSLIDVEKLIEDSLKKVEVVYINV